MFHLALRVKMVAVLQNLVGTKEKKIEIIQQWNTMLDCKSYEEPVTVTDSIAKKEG